MKKEDGLRPLSEKEIQKKLYGEFHKGAPAVDEEEVRPSQKMSEKTEAALHESAEKAPSLRGPNPFRPRPGLQKPTSPTVLFSLPWRDFLSIFFRASLALGNFLKEWLAKLGTAWGMGAAIVVAIFVAVHLLNAYRTTAMETARQRPVRVTPRAVPRALSSAPAPAAFEDPVPPTIDETPLKAPSLTSPEVAPVIERKEPEPPLPARLFTLQIATYARAEDAQALLAKLERQGLKAFSRPSPRSNGKVFHPVYVGRLATFQEAQAKLKEFKARPLSKEFPDCFIRSLSNP